MGEERGGKLKCSSFQSGITFHLQRVRKVCSLCNVGGGSKGCEFKNCDLCKETQRTGSCQECLIKTTEKCELCNKEAQDYSFCYIRKSCSSMDWEMATELSNMDQKLAIVCLRCGGDNTIQRIFTRLSRSLNAAKGLRGSTPLNKD